MTKYKIIHKPVNYLRLFLINLTAAIIFLAGIILVIIGLVKGVKLVYDSSLPLWVFELALFIFISITMAITMTFSSKSVEIQKKLNSYLDN